MRSYRNAAARKAEICKAALALFSDQGFRCTTMEQIATNVKVARTTLYEYYRSKEDILYALIDEATNAYQFTLPKGPVRLQLEILVEESVKLLQEHETLYQILFRGMPVLEGQTADKIRVWRNRLINLAQDAIEKGVEAGEFLPGVAAEDITCIFRAVILHRQAELLLEGESVDAKKEAKRLVNLLWCGIGKRD